MEERGEPYRVALNRDLPEDAVISFYRQGDFTDLCRRPPRGQHEPLQVERPEAHQLHRGVLARQYRQTRCSSASRNLLYDEGGTGQHLERIEEAKTPRPPEAGRELDLFALFDEGPASRSSSPRAWS
jgi:threonyl-tRNA synthetase